MHEPYRRAFELHLAINLLFAFAVALPIAAISSHFLPAWFSLGGILLLWGLISGVHLLLTLALIPKLATWLARKDMEREARRASQRG
jgi:hypothetical protein